jgi:hypothetical protein
MLTPDIQSSGGILMNLLKFGVELSIVFQLFLHGHGFGPSLSPSALFDNQPAEQVFVGVISDFACGQKHTMHPNITAAECTKLCKELGSKLSLVIAEKVYALEGDTDELIKNAGEKTVIRGVLNEQTQVIRVTAMIGSKPQK